jgi:hypothetical protein
MRRAAQVMKPRVIFLDIDGVLAPIRRRDRYSELDPACVAVLNAIVEQSGAVIVVSSSLRFGKTVAGLQELLEAHGFRGRVIGATPTNLRGYDRGDENGAWLTEHPIAGCVILDDHRDMGELLGYLVQTDAALGLRPADAERALEKLAQDMAWSWDRTFLDRARRPSG